MRAFYIGIFGLLGVFARYGLSLMAARAFPQPFPYGTFFVNLSGAFVVGAVYVLGAERAALSEEMRVGIMVGFLGGFTTFSSYCLEVTRLVEEGEYGYAGLYVSLSTILGLGATFGGILLARKLISGGVAA